MNILITAASRRVSLIRFFKQALMKLEPEGKIITTDLNALSPGLYFGDKFYYAPLCTSPEYIETIKKICRLENISLIIPTIDEELPLYGNLKYDFARMGIRVVVSSYHVGIKCNDKFLTFKFFLEKGIPTPATYLPNDIKNSKSKFPLFIKPRFGRGSVNAFMARSREELNFFLSYVENPIIQDYLRGCEFTIDVLTDFDGKVLVSIPRQRLLIRAGVSDRGKTLANRELVEWGKRIVEELGAIGPVNIQGKIDENEIKFFEINPRFSGGIPLTIKSGPNFPELIIRLHKGEKIEPMIGDYKTDLVMMCYETGIFIDVDSVSDIKPGQGKTPYYHDMF